MNQSRRDQYGDLEDNFQTIAMLWNGYLFGATEYRITEMDVANMMVLLKCVKSTARG